MLNRTRRSSQGGGLQSNIVAVVLKLGANDALVGKAFAWGYKGINPGTHQTNLPTRCTEPIPERGKGVKSKSCNIQDSIKDMSFNLSMIHQPSLVR